MLHMICTRLLLGHLNLCVGDDLQRSEEIVKKISNCAFECDYYYYVLCILILVQETLAFIHGDRC